MTDWLMRQTETGSTYLQVIILMAVFLFVIIPAAYIVVRDWARIIRQEIISIKEIESGDTYEE